MSHARDNRVSFQREGYGRQQQSQEQAIVEGQKITEDQRAEIRQAFDLFDQDGDGYLDFHEFKFGLKTLGFDLPKATVYDLLTTQGVTPPWHPEDVPCPGPSLRITAPAFEGVAGTLMANRDPREDLGRAFDLFDVDRDGIISIEDLKQVNRSIKQGASASDDDLKNMIAQADLTGKGGVNKDEFIDMMVAAKRRRGYGK